MTTIAGERPAPATTAWLRFAASDRVLACPVAASDARRLVLAPPASPLAPGRDPRAGHRAEVSWSLAGGLGALPVELVGVQRGPVPLWHFRPAGPAERVQRRGSVRVSLAAPVEVVHRGWSFLGTTTDLSEGGFRGAVAGPGALPGPGDDVELALFLDIGRGPLLGHATVVRSRAHGCAPAALVARFTSFPEQVRDRIRARVFLEQRHRRVDRPAQG